ncbi:MAG: isopentenyl-diphosphate Delta-isomerase [Pseudomonadota bacterium]
MQDAHRVVSSESEELILVTGDDQEDGYLSKAECHDGAGILHRAFSVFLFNADGELLLQQRSAGKRLWPGFWSNTCCSHPRRGESMAIATQRRLDDELNIETDLEYIYKFTYQARFGELGSEHELCYVYLGRVDSEVVPNAEEISATRWVPANEVADVLAATPDDYTPWFQMEWQTLISEHAEALSRYTQLS